MSHKTELFIIRCLLVFTGAVLFASLFFLPGCATVEPIHVKHYSVDVRRESKHDMYVCGYPEEWSRLHLELACVPLEDYVEELQKPVPSEPQHVL